MANEKRLIDANELQSKLQGHHDFFVDGWGGFDKMSFATKCRVDEIDNCIAEIVNAPTVEAVPVVHGRWLYDSGSGKYFCSACDEYALSFKKDTLYGGDLYEVCLTDYCPNCGAKMDGERKDNERKAD